METEITGGNGRTPSLVPASVPSAPPVATASASVAAAGPRVTCKLEEELGDQRSNHVTYRFAVENRSSASIDLFVPVVRVVKGVTVKPVTTSAKAEEEQQRLALAAELEKLLERVAIQQSEAFRGAWAETVQATFKKTLASVEAANPFTLIVLVVWRLMVHGKKFREAVMRDMSVVRFAIRSAADARAGYDKWLAKDGLPAELLPIRDLVALKIEQLAALEDKLGHDRVVIATVEPGATFSQTYVLEFPRTFFDPRKDQISIEAEYREASGIVRRVNASETLLISPRPTVMSLIAILASAAGLSTHLFLAAKKANTVVSFQDLLRAPWLDGSFFIAAAVAFVFFNIYEHTKLAKALGSIRIGWRAAALIGFLCGLTYDRILDALTALIG